MFLFIGKGNFTKEKLIDQLRNMKVVDAEKVVAEVERKGRANIGSYTIFAY